jgi:hypothetical protein
MDQDLAGTWGLSQAEANGLDPAAVTDLAAATAELRRRVQPDRLNAVIRRPADALGGRSLRGMVAAGECAAVREAVRRMFEIQR